MEKIKTFIVVSRYKENYDWIKNYSFDFLIYNKGNPIYGNSRIVNLPNIGGNQRDLFYFISSHYTNLPDTMAFIQGDPFDHCRKDVFDKVIGNDKFTCLEFYGESPGWGWESRDEKGEYIELNNSWYIDDENKKRNQTCRYSSFEEFMNKYFENYIRLDWIKFSPGSQYLIEKHQALQYPKIFWEHLMNELNSGILPTEGFILERAMYYILAGAYTPRREFCE